MSEGNSTAPRPKRSTWLIRLCVVAVLVLAAAVRLINLRSSPGWYLDECVFVGQAWNLIHGQFVWEAAHNTFLPRLPLFHILAGAPMLLFGKDILFVRLVTALSGIAMTWLVYRTGRLFGGRRAAVIGAALFAICPYVVLVNRWGFTYNLAAVLGAANLFFLLKFWRKRDAERYLWLAVLFASLSLVTEPNMAPRWLLTACVAFICVRPLRAVAASIAMLIPLLAYVSIMFLFHHDIFVEDIGVILSGRVGGSSDWLTLGSTLDSYLNELGGYGYLALTGIAFIPSVRGRGLFAAAFLLDLAGNLKLAGDDASRFYRMGIVLAPPLFVGAGFLLDEACSRLVLKLKTSADPAPEWRQLYAAIQRSESLRRAALLAGKAFVGIAVVCLVVLMGQTVWRGIAGSFNNVPKNYVRAALPASDIPDAEAIAGWLAPQLNPDDLVVTTHIDWMFDCRTVSPMLAQVAEGASENDVYHAGLAERLIYPCRMRDARFAIVHAATPGLAAFYDLEETLRPVFDEWELVRRESGVSVYTNPAHADGAEQP